MTRDRGRPPLPPIGPLQGHRDLVVPGVTERAARAYWTGARPVPAAVLAALVEAHPDEAGEIVTGLAERHRERQAD